MAWFDQLHDLWANITGSTLLIKSTKNEACGLVNLPLFSSMLSQ